jgi:predicted ester cyclase
MEPPGEPGHGGRMNTIERNKQTVEDFISAVFTQGDLGAVDRYLSPDFINHDPPFPGAPEGPEGMRRAGEIFRRAFPDWRSDVQQLIAEDDLVVENFIAHGTHRAGLMGEAPTGREVVLRGVNIFRLADGMIVERWGRLDHLGLLQQLDLAPMEPQRTSS